MVRIAPSLTCLLSLTTVAFSIAEDCISDVTVLKEALALNGSEGGESDLYVCSNSSLQMAGTSLWVDDLDWGPRTVSCVSSDCVMEGGLVVERDDFVDIQVVFSGFTFPGPASIELNGGASFVDCVFSGIDSIVSTSGDLIRGSDGSMGFTGCRFENIRYENEFVNVGDWHSSLTVADCTFENITGDGIFFYGPKSMSVVDSSLTAITYKTALFHVWCHDGPREWGFHMDNVTSCDLTFLSDETDPNECEGFRLVRTRRCMPTASPRTEAPGPWQDDWVDDDWWQDPNYSCEDLAFDDSPSRSCPSPTPSPPDPAIHPIRNLLCRFLGWFCA